MMKIAKITGLGIFAAMLWAASHFTTDKTDTAWTGRAEATASAALPAPRPSTAASPEAREVRRIAIVPKGSEATAPAPAKGCEDQVWPNIAPACLTRETTPVRNETKETRAVASSGPSTPVQASATPADPLPADPITTGALPRTPDVAIATPALPGAVETAPPARKASRAGERRRVAQREIDWRPALPARLPTSREPIQFRIAEGSSNR